MTDRQLRWDGCHNVRDLGGLPTADGGRIRPGALVRADALERLSASGWAALEAHGVRTVIDLRNDDEIGEDDAPRPAGITTVHLPLDGMEDTEFWEQWMHRPEFGTPHYYGPWLERFPDRAAKVLTEIARAAPGGVAIHCVGGRDRTGLVTMLVLALAGVPADVVGDDYARSLELVPDAVIAAFYAESGSTPAGVLADVLGGVHAERYLSDDDLAALRDRMLERLLSAAGRPSRPAAATPRPAR